jgi:hypothetical protein
MVINQSGTPGTRQGDDCCTNPYVLRGNKGYLAICPKGPYPWKRSY